MNFRKYHLINLLKEYEKRSIPLDNFVREYFRSHKQIGSKDRKEISEKLYTLIRWRGLVDFFTQKPLTWEKRVETIEIIDLNSSKKDPSIPPHIRWSFPKYYFDWLVEDYGLNQAEKIAEISNQKAPIFLRANLLKISRENLISLLEKKFHVEPCKECKTGIKFHGTANFFALDEFRKGFFEIQDLGSQLVAEELNPTAPSQVLDFCSGSGGKALAFAPKLNHHGQIYLHDIRKKALLSAKKRCQRAGLQNIQFFHELSKMNHLIGKMDWVLVDAPCSGSGTLRRNPDMKWRFEPEFRNNLCIEQRKIFETAFKFLKRGGKIVYATCSLFKAENEDQIEYFSKKHYLKIDEEKGWLPQENGMDGFFVAVFSHNCP